MNRNIVVEEINFTPVEDREIEIVERKGIGHPDSVADGIAESISRELSRYYLKNYDRILHHNTDQAEIVGGQAKPKFGGGQVLEPVYILLSGRATTLVEGERVPYRTIAKKAAVNFLKKHYHNLDIEEDVIIDCMIGQGSVDLKGLYDTQKQLANDTSFGVGYAPMSDLETVVYNTERYINGELKKRFPEVGEDVKVMGFRNGDKMDITIAAAFVGRHTPDADHYMSVKEELHSVLTDYATKFTDKEVNYFINTGDIPKENIYYLTVTGLSMENGDDGSVGRGNRVNGLITPYRPMSMEASAGKNPVTHVGKLYNLLAFKIAEDVVKEAGGDIKEAHVRIVSQIGKPIDQPQVASVQIIPAKGVSVEKYKKSFYAIADDWLENIHKITEMILNDEIDVF
ncbi:MAG: methionine adenosyltransferase [Euryarchaeota archaeon]|nr:methionine adenosyltransferase [Euryarchaeota archaeon]